VSIEHTRAFLLAALSNPGKKWDPSDLSEVAVRTVPDIIMGPRHTLLQADIRLLWARWFLEGVLDPMKLASNGSNYPKLFQYVLGEIKAIFAGGNDIECQQVARSITRLIDEEARSRQNRARGRLNIDVRRNLIEASVDQPRCWICGYRFGDWAVQSFLGNSNMLPPSLPLFVDFLKPRGLSLRDLKIEVDHVTPFSEGGGGESNLRLACGWCNSNKGQWISLYDVGTKPYKTIKHPRYGNLSIPRGFWVVRLLAIKRQCEWQKGCENKPSDSELTVAPKHDMGVMNPTNLVVTCLDHDPLGSDRLVHRKLFG
jgi:hypothetical protein